MVSHVMGDTREQRGAVEATSKRSLAMTPNSVALLYLRAEQVLQVLPVSRRTISNWQRTRRIKFYRIGRTILFKRSDIETCLEKFAVNPIGEPKPRRQNVETGTTTTQPKPPRKRRMTRDVSAVTA